MKTNYALAIIAMLVAFLLPSSFALASSQQPAPQFYVVSYWGTQASPVLAYPGASGLPLTLSVVYLGPATLYNVNITYSPTYPLTSVSGQGNLSVLIPALSPGQSVSMFGFFNVNSSASTKAYEQTLKISYYVQTEVPSVGEVFLPFSENLTFKVYVLGNYSIRLAGYRTTPIKLYSGMTAGALTVYLTNNGNVYAKDVNVSISFGKGLAPLQGSSESYFASYIPAGSLVNFTFPFVVEYNSSVPYPFNSSAELIVKTPVRSYSYTIPISVAPAAYFELQQSYYPRLSPGSNDVPITVEVSNVGGSEAKFLTVTLLYNPIFSPYAPSSENPIIAAESINETFYLINPGQSFNVTYVINVASGIRPGTYTLPLLISWRQPPTMQQMYEIINVPVRVQQFTLFDGVYLYSLYIIAAAVIAVLALMAIYGIRRK